MWRSTFISKHHFKIKIKTCPLNGLSTCLTAYLKSQTTVSGNNSTCCSLVLTLLIVCYDLQGSRYIHGACPSWLLTRVKYHPISCLCLTCHNPTKKNKKKTKQNKGIHTELIIISCFSGVSFTGRGPPASRSRSTRWSFYCWSIMLIFYSWLWNRFHSAQITLLLCYHSPPLSHTHTHICTHTHTCTHTCTHGHMHTQTLLKRFKSARDSNIYTHKRWFPMGSERMFFSDQKWHFCLICRLKQIS